MKTKTKLSGKAAIQPAPKPKALKHTWLSNRAFAAIYGVAKVCMVCGETDSTSRVCPGSKAED